MDTLNLGIVAHVDAGKTSLTERLLYDAGVIPALGSVDSGSTHTDSLALERHRGITIKSAVGSFRVAGTAVNIIDTPGHPDFIAEVDRALGLLDGAVLVVSAVEGVQPQTRVLMRALRRMRVPTVVFVNKSDRPTARPGDVAAELRQGLGVLAVPVDRGPDVLVETLAENDDALLGAYVRGARPRADRLHRALAAQTRAGLVCPVFTGSAITGAGVGELAAALPWLLPVTRGRPTEPLRATVFKLDRGPAGERIAWVRMFAGSVRVRDRLAGHGRVTGIEVAADGVLAVRTSIAAGQIGTLRGLDAVGVGDELGVAASAARQFPPPTLETVVVPDDPARRHDVYTALTRVAEQDPLLDLRRDDGRDETLLSLYGEVQKEVVAATLADEFGVGVSFRDTTTICVERVTGTGAAAEFIAATGNPFLATVGLRVQPAPVGSGVGYRLEAELGSMPFAFLRAVEETVRATLRAGGLCGWRVTDCLVTLTHTGYAPRQSHMGARFDKSMSSTGADFRLLTPLVLMAALRRAGTAVCEPVHRFRLEAPGDLVGPVQAALARLGATGQPSPAGGSAVLDGEIAAARLPELQRMLPSLTRGEGALEVAFERYRPVRGEPPTRPRTDHDPLDRVAYLRRALGRT